MILISNIKGIYAVQTHTENTSIKFTDANKLYRNLSITLPITRILNTNMEIYYRYFV